MEEDSVLMGFDSPTGVGNAMRDRLTLGVSEKGEPFVTLLNNETKIPVRLTASNEGGGIEFLDYDRANSQVIIRRISFAGEEKQSIKHDFPPDDVKSGSKN